MDGKLKMIEVEVISVHESTDQEMQGVKTVCGKFCSNCCYQSVGIHGVEGLVIESFIKDVMPQKIKKTVKKNVTRWLLAFNRMTPTADMEQPLSTSDFYKCRCLHS